MGPIRNGRLGNYKQDRLIQQFYSKSIAVVGARLCFVNCKTAAFFFLRLRETIALEFDTESEGIFGGEIEVDESYFGGTR